jgi:hypothetical protein
MGSDIDPIDLDYPEITEREDDGDQTARDSHVP